MHMAYLGVVMDRCHRGRLQAQSSDEKMFFLGSTEAARAFQNPATSQKNI